MKVETLLQVAPTTTVELVGYKKQAEKYKHRDPSTYIIRHDQNFYRFLIDSF